LEEDKQDEVVNDEQIRKMRCIIIGQKGETTTRRSITAYTHSMNSDLRGTATVRRRDPAGTAIITVGVRFEEVEFSIKSNFERPVVLQPRADCRSQYSSDERLYRGCEGAAHSGVFYATRDFRDRCGCVVFTTFDGAELPPDCGQGFATAAALACFRALGEHDRAHEMDMEGWEEI